MATTVTPTSTVTERRATHAKTCEVKERAWAELAEMQASKRQFERVLIPHQDAQTPSPRDVLRARIELQKLNEQLMEQEDAARAADEAEVAARSALREVETAAERARQRAIVAKLVPLLRAVQVEVDALRASHARAAVPDGALLAALAGFQSSTPSFQNYLDAWFAAAKQYYGIGEVAA